MGATSVSQYHYNSITLLELGFLNFNLI
uniref:Uncharacterized protein n=1 Tax=Vitis vinifera TaxID=29760 RepID=F6I635_VITVI